MHDSVNPCRKTLLWRLSVILFFAELGHGMLLYSIIPDLVTSRFPPGGFLLFNLIPVKEEVAGLCVAAYTFAELLFKVPMGHWVDRRGPDGALRFGLVVSLGTVPLILMSKNPHWMLLGAFLHGMGASPVWPAVISSWTRGRSAKERGEIMGQILTGWMAGLGIGVITGNFVVGFSGRAELAVNYTPVFTWVVTVVAALWSGQRLGYPAHHGREPHEIRPEDSRFPPELKIMAIGLFLQNLVFGNLIIPFNLMARQHLELSAVQLGLVFLLGGAPAVALLGPMGKVTDRIGRRNSVIGAMLTVAPLIALAPLMAYLPVSPWVRLGLMVPGLVIAGVAYALLLPAWHALALGRIPEQQRGRSLALLMSVEMAALATGNVLGTPLYNRLFFGVPFFLAGSVFGVLALIYRAGYILPPEVHEEPHEVDLGPLSPNDNGNGHAKRPALNPPDPGSGTADAGGPDAGPDPKNALRTGSTAG